MIILFDRVVGAVAALRVEVLVVAVRFAARASHFTGC